MSFFFSLKKPLILASSSSIRKKILTDAGMVFESCNSNIDENILKISNQNALSPKDLTLMLAETKARAVSEIVGIKKAKTHLILGCDQTLWCNGRLFNKSSTRQEAFDSLQDLNGRVHTLLNGVILLFHEEVIWRYADRSMLTMRSFSTYFLNKYLDKVVTGVEADIFNTVGCYQLESFGVQLFSHIEGDMFSILGFPIVHFMNALYDLDLI